MARNLKFTGPYHEPPGGFGRTGPARRLAYWARYGEALLREKRKEILLGVGGKGAGVVGKLRPRKRKRADGADGAVLAPHDQDSRTYRLLAAHPTPNGVTLFWRGHGRKSWSSVLHYHAEGLGRYGKVAVRNHFILSDEAMKRAHDEAVAWWVATSRARPASPAKSVPLPQPQQAPPAPKPAPAPKAKKEPRGALERAREALVSKYAYLAEYVRPRGGGF